MTVVRVEREIAGRTLVLESGRVAHQAHGAVWTQYGDTVVLATVLTAPPTRDIDFFPLYVDYRENQYSAGKIPGGFFKREGRPSAKEICTMRMIDRPCRPLFADDFKNEVQIQIPVLSADNENDPDLVAMIGASAALAISPAPWQGPIGAARVGYVDGEFVLNPTHSDLENSTMDLLVCGPKNAPNMLECEGAEVSEKIVNEGIAKGFEVVCQIIDAIEELKAKVEAEIGIPECEYEPKAVPPELKQMVLDRCGERIREAKKIVGKVERSETVKAIREELVAELCPEDAEEPQYTPGQVKEAFYKTEGVVQRELILGGLRPGGRAMDELRSLSATVGVLPRTHGSALFSRGETQALAVATLGTPRDDQVIDGLDEEYKKKFMLHYNFPPFSVGEIRPIRGPGRREIGHGMLAEKSLTPVMPSADDFPYTVRVVADILESNGSTSQAATCGATLAMMDAGVPLKAPVAGISIGMVSDGDRYVLLTDIMGEEDFHGDMDFKVAGTREGITGIQLDMKAPGIPLDRIGPTLEAAKQARLKILDTMAGAIPAPREEISRFAPRMLIIKIDPAKIGKVIGPGGKTINAIQDETGANLDVENDGTIYISSTDADGAEEAKERILALTEDVEVDKIYKGTVVSIQPFGAFIEILPGQDGLCHISELDRGYVKEVTDVVQIGDEVTVKCIAIDPQGRVKLSRKVLMDPVEGEDETPKGGREGGRQGGGGGKHSRGPRRGGRGGDKRRSRDKQS